MKQIRLTPDKGTSERTVKKFYDWLLAKRVKNELPFTPVMVDTDANEQYGVLIQCGSLHDRDAVLAALKELQDSTYPEANLMKENWAQRSDGSSVARGVGVRELWGQPIGKVFE